MVETQAREKSSPRNRIYFGSRRIEKNRQVCLEEGEAK